MSLFRVDPDCPFSGPHQDQPVATAGTPLPNAATAMILVHGRGASAESMLLFADEFNQDDIHYRAIQARGHSWYPRSFLAPRQQNQPGINSGLQAIADQVAELNRAGVPTSRMVLLGFSQGACLTSEYAARHPDCYGGVIAFSGGLIGEEIDPDDYSGTLEETPVFLGCSDRDPHIPLERVEETEQVFRRLKADVTKKIYKGMGHTVNEDEIATAIQLLHSI